MGPRIRVAVMGALAAASSTVGCTLIVDGDRYRAPECHFTVTGDVEGSGVCHQYLCRIEGSDELDIVPAGDPTTRFGFLVGLVAPRRFEAAGTYDLAELDSPSFYVSVTDGTREFVTRQRSTADERLTVTVESVHAPTDPMNGCAYWIRGTVEADLVETAGLGRAHLTIALGD